MEQYWMPKKLDFKNLKLALKHYEAERIFIRDCGGIREDGQYSAQGRAKVDETLEGKTLDFKKNKSGLYILIDSKEVFHFTLKEEYEKGFSVGYERIKPTEDGIGRKVYLSTGIDPYDPELPEPRISLLRSTLDYHLIEIFFKGRVNLKFHSWWNKECEWKYWTIATPEEGKNIQKARDIEEAIKKQQEEYDLDDSR